MIDIDKMFQLLTELEPDTVLFERSSRSPDGYVEWVRKVDGSYIDWPEKRLITVMQTLKLLDTEPLPLPGSKEAIRFKLSDKARRLLQARQECGPTHRTPYVGEYCWLIVHECAGGKDVYPYLGAAPPDLAKVVERREDVSREGEHFHVRCYPLDGYLSDEECLLIADTHHMSP